MSGFPGPSVAEERAEAVRRLHPGVVAETGWRYNGIVLRIVFAVLTTLAVLAFFGFFALFFKMQSGLLTAAVAIGTAEGLIRGRRFFGTGIEPALWLCGCFAFLAALPSWGSVEALLAFAAVSALPGWRMRSAFMGVLAAVLVVVYVAAKWDDVTLTILVASIITIAAAAALRRLWQRPSTEKLFAGTALVMPVAGYLATIVTRIFGHKETSVQGAVVLAVTAILLLVAGIVWRDRMLLVSAVLSAALAVIELRDLFYYSAETELFAAGIVVAVIAVVLTRVLRNATRGFVVTPVAADAYAEAMQVGGIISVAPHGSAPPAHSHTGPDLADSAGPTDKSYGGGGAGGGF